MSNDRAKCNTIFVNLLRFHGQQDTLSTAFIREFFETVRCDRVFDMSIHRDELRKSSQNRGWTASLRSKQPTKTKPLPPRPQYITTPGTKTDFSLRYPGRRCCTTTP